MSHVEITFRIPIQAKEISVLDDDVKREINGEACFTIRRYHTGLAPLERVMEEARAELERLFQKAVDGEVQWNDPPGSG